MSVPAEHDEKLPLGCTAIELVQGVEVLLHVLLRATDDFVCTVADQGGLCFVCRQHGQEGRKVDLPKQFRNASHLSRGQGRGVRPEGADGMRMRVEEGEVDGSVAVESLPGRRMCTRTARAHIPVGRRWPRASNGCSVPGQESPW